MAKYLNISKSLVTGRCYSKQL